MKIPLGKIASWIGRALLSAIVSEAADRLSRQKGASDRDEGEHRDNYSLDK